MNNKNELKQKYLQEAQQARAEAAALQKIEILKNKEGLYFGGTGGELTQRAVKNAYVSEYIGYKAGCIKIYCNGKTTEIYTRGYIDELPEAERASKPLKHGKESYIRQSYTLTPDELSARILEWAKSKEKYASKKENAAAVIDEAFEIAKETYNKISDLSNYEYFAHEFFSDLIKYGG